MRQRERVYGLCWPAMGFFLLLLVAALLVTALAVAALLYGLGHPRRKTYAAALGRGDPTEPEAVGATGRSVTFTLADGSTAPAWSLDGHAPDGPVVLVLHGFADSRYGALTWAPLLLPHASRVVIYDQRGHGESSAPRSTLGAHEAADAAAVIDQLEETSDAPVVLFGYSMGAVIALAAATERPGRVAGVIADGVYRHWATPVHSVLRQKRYPATALVALARAALWCAAPAYRDFDRIHHARQLRCPLLALHGTADACCPLNDAQAIVDAAPHGELVTFPDGEHLDLAAREPQRYRDALAKFFSALHAPDPRSSA